MLICFSLFLLNSKLLHSVVKYFSNENKKNLKTHTLLVVLFFVLEYIYFKFRQFQDKPQMIFKHSEIVN